MNSLDSTEAQDDKAFREQSGKIDPEKVKWLENLKLSLTELGFTQFDAENFVEDTDIEFDFTMDACDFAEDLRFCPAAGCEWEGRSGDLHEGYCPKCQNIKL